MNILTGEHGYLLRHLKPYIPLNGFCYHFGCPIDSSTVRNRILLKQHVEDTKNLITKCRQFNLKLIYASSLAVEYETEDLIYKQTKISVEQLLDPNIDLIWRIPRIYSLDRTRGIIPKLLEGHIYNHTRILEWVFIDDFIKDFVSSIHETGIRHYRGIVHKTAICNILKELECISSQSFQSLKNVT